MWSAANILSLSHVSADDNLVAADSARTILRWSHVSAAEMLRGCKAAVQHSVFRCML